MQFISQCYHFFFFYWLYNPGWVLVCSTILFHSCLSSTFILQPIIFFLFRSPSTCSIHLSLCFRTGLVEFFARIPNFIFNGRCHVIMTVKLDSRKNVCNLLTFSCRHGTTCHTLDITIIIIIIINSVMDIYLISFLPFCWNPLMISGVSVLQLNLFLFFLT